MTKQELEQMGLTHLCVLCGKVADDSSMDATTAEKASKLKQEWVALIARETPSADYETHKKIEAEKQVLKARMVELLMLV
jgi:hypothetical protein